MRGEKDQRWWTVFSRMRDERGAKIAESIQQDERLGRSKYGGQYSAG
jgi:hypothetical protein